MNHFGILHISERTITVNENLIPNIISTDKVIAVVRTVKPLQWFKEWKTSSGDKKILHIKKLIRRR